YRGAVEHPAQGEHHRRGDHGREDRVDAGLPPQEPRHSRDQDEERALGDVDDPHDPEDQGQPGGHQRVHAADEDPEDEDLDELRHGLYFQSGFGLTTVLVVATAGGATTSTLL